jgi:hypothetical protein
VVDYRGFIAIPGEGFALHTKPLDKLTDGKVQIRDLKLKNTRISILDMNVNDGSTDFIFSVEIEKIAFDFRDFTASDRDIFDEFTGPAAIEIHEISDNINLKGNIIIDKCKFISSNINFLHRGFDGPDTGDNICNLIISNNFTMDNTFFLIAGYNIYRRTIDGDPDINRNITFVGNHNTSTFDIFNGESGAQISLNEPWGDKFSRDVLANNFKYNNNKYRDVVYTFENITHNVQDGAATDIYSWANDGFPFGAGAIALSAADVDIQWPALVANAAPIRLRLYPNSNETLETVTLGVLGHGGVPINWTVKIEYADLTGGGDEDMFTQIGPTRNADSPPATPGVNIESMELTSFGQSILNTDRVHFLNLEPDNIFVPLLWVKIRWVSASVEGRLGLKNETTISL